MTVLLALIFAASEFAIAKRAQYSFATEEVNRFMAQSVERVRAEITEMHPKNDRFLNLTQSHLNFIVQESPCLNDAFLYRVLWNNDTLSMKPLLDKIKEQYFGLIILSHYHYSEEPPDRLKYTVYTFYSLEKEGYFCYFVPKARG